MLQMKDITALVEEDSARKLWLAECHHHIQDQIEVQLWTIRSMEPFEEHEKGRDQ